MRRCGCGDAASFAAWFSEGATCTFANNETLRGRANIEAATAGAAGALPWVRHGVDQVAEIGDQLFCRFTIHTEAPDGTSLALPCVTVIWLSDDEITDYRLTQPAASPCAQATEQRLGRRYPECRSQTLDGPLRVFSGLRNDLVTEVSAAEP
ncbi:nuclear transport factor 2 family protein [Streptomyces sp. NPDC059441]|uniref:nuclear transport factor 2 family protein n=1 Tax=Streptomyces sp. NPDC059441 TaxID=3346829 RepID=UPI0036A8902A